MTSSNDAIELTIVMPCLNEALTLGACIEQAQQMFKTTGIVGEVVIGDNGSTDGSQQIARNLGARVVDRHGVRDSPTLRAVLARAPAARSGADAW